MDIEEIFSFLTDLRENNDREWFAANKQRYLAVKEQVDDMAAHLIAGIAEFDPAAASLTPADCTYRIYRDTRFSLDKTPYKTHIGIVVCPGGSKKSYRCGYYVHMEPGASFIGGGCWCPPPALLKEIRQSIYDNIDEYLGIVENPEFRDLYGFPGHDLLKTAPKGFPKDWEYIEFLKPREYTVMTAESDRFFFRKNTLSKILDDFRVLKPYNDFINYIFEEKPELMSYPQGRRTHRQ